MHRFCGNFFLDFYCNYRDIKSIVLSKRNLKDLARNINAYFNTAKPFDSSKNH